MRIGLNLGYVTTAEELIDNIALAQAAESLGFDTVWAAEAYGSDAVTVLAAIAARTHHIGIGSAVLQIPGRSPAMTAMTAATLDALSSGRFTARARSVRSRRSPRAGTASGSPIRSPVPASTSRSYGRPSRATGDRPTDALHAPVAGRPGQVAGFTLQPVRPTFPIYLAAVGPRTSISLARSPTAGSPSSSTRRSPAGCSVRSRPPPPRRPRPRLIDVVPSVPVSATTSTVRRPGAGYAALYIGGMGRPRRTSTTAPPRMGYGEAADEVQDQFIATGRGGAAAAVPWNSSTGRACSARDRIADRLRRLSAAGCTLDRVAVRRRRSMIGKVRCRRDPGRRQVRWATVCPASRRSFSASSRGSPSSCR